MTSIKDIAQLCGVNPATVSRAMNDRKGVSAAVRERIVGVAAKLGYSKDPLAASLITKRSGLIGLVVPDITNPYYAAVAKGVNAALAPEGYAIFLCDADRDRGAERRYFDKLCQYRVEGVIVMSVTATPQDLEIFTQRHIPVVCADNPLGPKFSAVINNNYQGACELATYLVRDVHVTRLIAVMGQRAAETTKQRLRGVRETLARLGAASVLHRTLYITSSYAQGYATAPQVLAERPDCIFAVNDSVALGIFNYCQSRGIDIPGQVKLAGYDDIEAAAMISVPLTTVHQHKFALGQKAAMQLLFEIEHPQSPPVKIELSPQLVIRESCGHTGS